MQRRQLLLLATAGALLRPAQARDALPPEIAGELPGARLHGSGRLRVFGFQVYDARLWSPAAMGPELWATAPLALELQYLRKLDGQAIAERSLQEMRRQGEIATATAERWLGAMRSLFPDVAAGDRITGVQVPGTGVRIFVNGTLKGEVRDTEFSRWFFGIWLSPRTSEPGMRDALLGSASAAAR
jgi:Chalcone isomerase-like